MSRDELAALLSRCCCRPPDQEAWQQFKREFDSCIEAAIERVLDRSPYVQLQTADVAQEVYARLYEYPERTIAVIQHVGRKRVRAFLSVVAANAARTKVRDETSKKRAPQEECVQVHETPLLDPRDDPVELLSAEEVLSLVEGALVEYGTTHSRRRNAMIFRLVYIHGVPVEELESRIGHPVTDDELHRIAYRVRTAIATAFTRRGRRLHVGKITR